MFSDLEFTTALLRYFDQIGWIPGPRETAGAFANRLKKRGSNFVPPCSVLQQLATHRIWTLFKVRPQGYRWQFDQSTLRFWQIGYFQSDGGDASDHIAIKAQGQGTRWRYSADEVLAHELAHAARAAFPADLYDEYLCYKTSDFRYRRLLGPYFSSFAAIPMICLSIMSCLILSLSLALFPNSIFEELAWRLWLLALTLQISIFLCYLLLFGLFALAAFRLKKTFGDGGSWWLFRLTQKEALKVALFSTRSLKEFKKRANLLPRDQLFADQLITSLTKD